MSKSFTFGRSAGGKQRRIASRTVAGSRYFCESFYGHPCPTSGKNHATAHACGGPSRSLRLRSGQALLLSSHTQPGVCHIVLAMTRRDAGKPAFSVRKKTLRENTCAIASGDYSTPVPQRTTISIAKPSLALC
ncbi:MAG: hypothetical protein PHY16_19645 [Methylobacter sp.]|nr:hypothetical protein [Methylobacter sp.]